MQNLSYIGQVKKVNSLAHRKQSIFEINLVKTCERSFVQKKKTNPIEVDFLLWKKVHIEFNQFDIWFCNFPPNYFDGGRQKKANVFQLSFHLTY